MNVEVNMKSKTLTIRQEITYFNQSNDTLSSIVLNDWNNAYSNTNTPLAKRFSDEFYRSFHLSKEEERGSTITLFIAGKNKSVLDWDRPGDKTDFVEVKLSDKLNPNQKTTLYLTYVTKIPSDKFSKYGYTDNGGMILKNWFLTPARYENHAFIRYNNNNLDDIANGVSDFDIELKTDKSLTVTSDLNCTETTQKENATIHKLCGVNRTDFSLYIESKPSFYSYKNDSLEVITNLNSHHVDPIQKAIVADRIIQFTSAFIGKYPFEKITVSQAEYDRNPFYGLNQLPPSLRPFPEEFIFELKFLKTYLNNYIKNTLRLDPRKDNWIYDGIQVYAMMKYMDENHPDLKMMGSISRYWLLKGFHLTTMDFNEQYLNLYLLMARKNLDQPLGSPKNTLIKFNEQIANKYHAGLSFKYLDDYLDDSIVTKSIQQFYALNKERQASRNDFETILKSNTTKNINWFFNTIIDSRDIIDYKFKDVSKTKDSVTFSLKNKTGVVVPISVYGIKNDMPVFKKWINPEEIDSTFTLERKNADKIVLNYGTEVPEFNLRNNWKSLKKYTLNRPIKFTLIKDLEDPRFIQVLYAPIYNYNAYDGFSPGIRFHNKGILNRPFNYDLNPVYSFKSNTLTGSYALSLNKDYRNSTLYAVRYSLSTSYYHYAQDASYFKLNPMVLFQIRQPNFRDNRKQFILARQVLVDREPSAFIDDNSPEDYSVFDAKYINTRTEFASHVNFVSDIQFSSEFGKVSGQIETRKLFDNNRQVNLRAFVGYFLYNTSNTDYFSFATDRPTDYLFDYNYYGRSESTGFFSQQYIPAEGGFKSKLSPPYANQWIATINGSATIWKWVDLYGDIGLVKNKSQNREFIYDSGIRIALLTDYYELFFPIYSNNGWEIIQNKYSEKIRFIITLDPNRLITLFTRKWF